MKAFVDNAVTNTASRARLHFGEIPNHVEIKAATGLELKGWKRKLIADEVRKILKDHGDAAKEAKRGQIAVTRADFKRIRAIVEKPDSIAIGGLTSGRKLQAITYEKVIDSTKYSLVEEIQPKRQGLAIHTMWKRKV